MEKSSRGGRVYIAGARGMEAWPADSYDGATGARRHGRGQGDAHCVIADAWVTAEQRKEEESGRVVLVSGRRRGGRRRRAQRAQGVGRHVAMSSRELGP